MEMIIWDIFLKWILPIGLSAIGGAMTYLGKKNKKWRKRAEQFNVMQKEIMVYVPLAEQFTGRFTGNDKKEWVLTKVNQMCLNNSIPYDHEKAEQMLEHVITLSKGVNLRQRKVGE